MSGVLPGAAALDVACHLNVLQPGWDARETPGALAALADLGYSRVVVPFFGEDAATAGSIARSCEDEGLAPIAMCRQTASADISSDDPDIAHAGAEWLDRQIIVAADHGFDHVTGLAYGVFRSVDPVPETAVRRTAERLGERAELAHERGALLTCEILNRYETRTLNTVRQGVAFVEMSGSAHLKLHVDTFHMTVEEADMRAAVAGALPHIGYIELGQSGRGRLSAGAFAAVDFIRDVLDLGYTGRWGVEAFSASVISPVTATVLSIWRDTYDDGEAIAADAVATIDAAWQLSERGRGPVARRDRPVSARPLGAHAQGQGQGQGQPE